MKKLTKLFLLLLTTSALSIASIDYSKINYHNMSTPELEKLVETLSIDEALPFEIGLELIERWTEK